MSNYSHRLRIFLVESSRLPSSSRDLRTLILTFIHTLSAPDYTSFITSLHALPASLPLSDIDRALLHVRNEMETLPLPQPQVGIGNGMGGMLVGEKRERVRERREEGRLRVRIGKERESGVRGEELRWQVAARHPNLLMRGTELPTMSRRGSVGRFKEPLQSWDESSMIREEEPPRSTTLPCIPQSPAEVESRKRRRYEDDSSALMEAGIDYGGPAKRQYVPTLSAIWQYQQVNQSSWITS